MRYLIFTDIHGNLEELLAMFKAIQKMRVDHYIFLGDLVDTGAKNEAQYPEWTKIAKGLQKPFYPIPGNHDPEDFFRKHVRPETDYAVDHKGYRFLLFQDTRTDSHLGTVTPDSRVVVHVVE